MTENHTPQQAAATTPVDEDEALIQHLARLFVWDEHSCAGKRQAHPDRHAGRCVCGDLRYKIEVLLDERAGFLKQHGGNGG